MSRKQTMRYGTMVVATVVMLVAAALAPSRLAGQGAPTVLYGCYVPTSGTVYRIKADGLPTDCRSKNHVQFTWSLQGPPGPQGPTGPAGPQGVAGPAGPLSGRVLVVAQGSAASNNIGSATASCPAGKKVLGGGFQGLTGNTTNVSHNMPKPLSPPATGFSDTEWQVTLYNADPFTLSFTVFAICANAE